MTIPFLTIIAKRRWFILLLPVCYNILFNYSVCTFKFDIANDTMKAVVLNKTGTPRVLGIQYIPIPKISENQVLVRVKACGINPVDAHLRSGTSYKKLELPAVLGKEIAGLVHSSQSDQFKVGERVFCGLELGGYAEYAVANSSNCFPLSKKLTFSQGASLYFVYFLVHRALISKGSLKMDELLFVHGASGSMGVAAIQIGKDRGAQVIVSVKDEDTEDLMYEAGADYVVFHEPNEDYYLEDALRHADREGFDLILEILRSVDLQRDKKYLARRGRIVLMGKSVTVDVGRKHLWTGERTVRGVSFFKFSKREQAAAADFILKSIERGNINPAIAHEYKFEEASKAHREMFNDGGQHGKIVLVPKRDRSLYE